MGWIADLLKEIPSAARYKAELEQLEAEHSVSQKKIADLESEKGILQSELTAAQEKIRNLETQLSERRGQRLETLQEKILQLLASIAHVPTSSIAQELQTTETLVEFHLQEMRKAKLVDRQQSLVEPPKWRLIQEGRRYLVTHGLLQ